jgi:hypothetical protein
MNDGGDVSKRSDNYEKAACSYLKSLKDGKQYKWTGGSDPTKPDIECKFGDVVSYIEVKMRSAQGAQILVSDVGSKFIYVGKETKMVKTMNWMLNMMSRNKLKYSSTTANVITKNQDRCCRILKRYYKIKGVKSFATKTKTGKWVITDIDCIKDKYTFEAVYRNKKSGSRKLPVKYDEDVIKLLGANMFKREGKRAFCLDKQKFRSYLSEDYFVGLTGEIRKLASRKDSCVLFKIKAKF